MKIPQKINLIHSSTPIRFLPRLSKEVGKNIFVWCDDLTASVEGGNKIRKLEFILYDALAQKADTLLTCGGPQSNHARATAYIARRLGLDIHILVRKPPQNFDEKDTHSANFLLNKICGAQLHFIEFEDYIKHGKTYDYFLEQTKQQLQTQGKKVYVIPEGASCPLGVWGYIAATKEMLSTWLNLNSYIPYPDSIICALGSGGTFAGLYMGAKLLNLPYKVFAFNVCDNKEYFLKRVGRLIQDTCQQFELEVSPTELNIIDGYVGQGYSLATDEDLKLYSQIAQKEGLLLDPCYTGKAFKGMLCELKNNTNMFGKNILFLHSGGIYGNFAYVNQYYQVL